MAQTVKGSIGDQPVELINAATETTLAALLAIAKKDSAALQMLAQKAGVDAKAIEKASKAMEENSRQAQSAGHGMGETASKASLLGGFLLDMGSATVKTMGNLVNFGDELIEGKARASDLFKAFKDLPLGLGLLASLFQKVMKYQEKNLDIYQAISGTGAGLNGSLAGLRTQASSLYLTMDELANMYKKNGDVLQQLGGSATSGSKALIGINQNLQRNFGPELSKLGFSFTEINDLLGGYLRVSGDGMRVNKKAADETARLAAAAANYGKELDYMARLSGESREATEKKMQAEAMEASWQAHLNTLEPKEREKANMAMNRAMTIGGKGAVDALKAELMGFAAPFSEEGQTFVSMTGEAAKAVSGLAKTVKDGSSVDAARTAQNKLQAAGIAGLIKDMKGFNNIVSAAGQGGAQASKGLMEMQAIVNRYNSSGKVNQEQIEKEIAQVIEKTEADSKAAAAAVATERRMKALSDQINTALLPIMDLLATHANKIVIKFTDFIRDVDFKKLGDSIASLMDKILEYGKKLFTEEGRAVIINDIKNLWKELLIEMKSAIGLFYGKNDAIYDRNEIMLNKVVVEAKEIEADALRKRNALNQKIYDVEHKKELENNKADAEAKKKALADDKSLTDEQRRAREQELDAVIKTNADRLSASKDLAENADKLKNAKIDLASFEQDWRKKEKDRMDYEARYERYKVAGWNPNKVTENKDDWDYTTAKKKRDTGSFGATGKLIENFGSGTDMELHGKEGVLTEQQLANLVTGAMNTGNIQAQNALTNALTALNKQQAMTNQLLVQSIDMQRKIAENQPSWMGNRFARVA
jgi:hypothetical protein